MHQKPTRTMHVALYGKNKIRRAYCKSCNQNALVLDGLLACCDQELDFRGEEYKRLSAAVSERQRPSKRDRKYILAVQGHGCLYCGLPFGAEVFRKNKKVKLKLTWDHWVPFSYIQDNGNMNFIAACHICNGIKGNKHFETVELAQQYIRVERDKKGIIVEFIDED